MLVIKPDMRLARLSNFVRPPFDLWPYATRRSDNENAPTVTGTLLLFAFEGVEQTNVYHRHSYWSSGVQGPKLAPFKLHE